ncbi:MAG: hypothetical protein HC795_04465 [Coleofasciculaceae cyanobacterium RL_1_1]|jgi:hypothetical protein|nr:hypothetical protein [Coleofasciculaceae cyanobacterium RL_1_1]
MERLTPIELQRQAIQDTLQEHCKIALDCRDTLQCDTFITSDPATDNYFMIGLDLPPKPQKYGVLIHLRLIDGKICIETNNVEDFIEDLIDRGIPEADLITTQRDRTPAL